VGWAYYYCVERGPRPRKLVRPGPWRVVLTIGRTVFFFFFASTFFSFFLLVLFINSGDLLRWNRGVEVRVAWHCTFAPRILPRRWGQSLLPSSFDISKHTYRSDQKATSPRVLDQKISTGTVMMFAKSLPLVPAPSC
jgi:hypothetical protein